MTEAAQKLGTLLEGIIGVDAGGRGLARVPRGVLCCTL